jgi:small subunit ribosomal protein S20
MPQTSQAKKALRVTKRRTAINWHWRKLIHSRTKYFRQLIAKKEIKRAEKFFPLLASALDCAARRNIIHPNTAARRKARLWRALARSKAQTQRKEKG